MYLQGEGVDKDEAKALEYFKVTRLKGKAFTNNSAIMLEELARVTLKDPKKMLI